MSPEPPGPRVFMVDIRSSHVPMRYHPPMNITKYGGGTDPGLWLKDYHLACHTGGTDSDGFIIRNLP